MAETNVPAPKPIKSDEEKTDADKFWDIHSQKYQQSQSNLGKIGYTVWNNQPNKSWESSTEA